MATTSTDGLREVRCCCRAEGRLGYWSTFLHQELVVFRAHFLAVRILSPPGIARLLLEVREGGEGRSTSCIKDRRSLLNTCLSTRFMKAGIDSLSSWWSLLLPWDLNDQNCTAGSSCACLDPSAMYYVTCTVFQPHPRIIVFKSPAICQDPDYNMYSRCCKEQLSL